MKNDFWKLKDDPFRLWVSVYFQFGERFVQLFRGGNFAAKKWHHLQNDGLGRRIWGGRNFSEGGTVKSHRYWRRCQDGCGKDGIFRNDLRQGIPSWRSFHFCWGAKSKLPGNILVTWHPLKRDYFNIGVAFSKHLFSGDMWFFRGACVWDVWGYLSLFNFWCVFSVSSKRPWLAEVYWRRSHRLTFSPKEAGTKIHSPGWSAGQSISDITHCDAEKFHLPCC